MKESSKPKVLVVYNGSTKGRLTGGEYAQEKIRQGLEKSFTVRELLLDNVVSRFKKSRLKPIIKIAIIPIAVLSSYLLYRNYDLVLTSWTPKLPFFGDLTYVQPFADASDVFENPDSSKRTIDIVTESLWTISNRFLRGPSLRRHTFVVNSRFVSENLLSEFGKKSFIVYPPVPCSPYFGPYSKQNLVLSAGRVVPSKNFELIQRVGSSIPEAKFKLIGSLGQSGYDVIDTINRGFSKHSMNNFSYDGWVTADEKQLLLRKSKVVFHPTPNEPFGIILVEGMLNGAIPVAHKSGGPKEFIPEEWLFDDDEDAISKVRRGLQNWSPRVADEMATLASKFSESSFQDHFGAIAQKIIDHKKNCR